MPQRFQYLSRTRILGDLGRFELPLRQGTRVLDVVAGETNPIDLVTVLGQGPVVDLTVEVVPDGGALPDDARRLIGSVQLRDRQLPVFVFECHPVGETPGISIGSAAW